MRRFALVVTAALLAACAKKEPPAPPPPPPEAPPAPAPLNLSTVAGAWTVNVMSATSDSTLLTYTLTATADTAGWTITFPKRKPMPVHVMVMGDSIMVNADSYESALRKGQKVSTNSVMHLVGDKLKGVTVAHYNTKSADSVVTLRSEGTRAGAK